MDIFVTDIDALRMMRIARTSHRLRLATTDLRAVTSRSGSRVGAETLRALEKLGFGSFSPEAPLHLRVSTQEERVHSRAVKSHVCSTELPSRSFLQIVPSEKGCRRSDFPDDLHVYLDSPALCAAQLVARRERLVKGDPRRRVMLVARIASICMELVGSYGRDPWQPRNAGCSYGLTPLCSAEELRDTLAQAQRLDGKAPAERVARWLSSGSASPMETALDLPFVLPPRFGGLTFPKPVLNEPLHLTAHQRSLVVHESMRPDLYWPDHLIALEFISKEFHGNPSASLEDAARVQDYQTCGITVFPVTYASLRNALSFEKLALRIADQMARRDGRAMRDRAKRLVKDPETHELRGVLLRELITPANEGAPLPVR